VRNRKILTTSISVICAAAMTIQVSILAAGNQKPGIEQQTNQTVTISKNVSSASEAPAKKFTVIKQIPDSKALDILAKTKTQTQTQTQTADIQTEVINPVLSKSKEFFKSTNTGTVNAAATDNSYNNPIDTIKAFFGSAQKGIKDVTAHMEDVSDGIQEVVFDYTNNAGERLSFRSGMYYDKANQLFYGKDGTGLFAFGYDFDINQLMLYAPADTWQRNLGFCQLYDIMGPMLNYDLLTKRIKFKYDGLDWMIQIWKGRYMITMGGEIGLYNKPEDRTVQFYDCAGDKYLMPISMTVLKGDDVILTKKMENCWWQTGFAFRPFYAPELLTLEGTIVFPNEVMKDAFTQAIDKMPLDKIAYMVDGNAVSFVW